MVLFFIHESVLDERQVNAEGCAFTGFAFDKNGAVMLFNGSITHRQPEARTFADLLRSKERLEDPSQGFFLYSQASVRNGDESVSSWRRQTIFCLRALLHDFLAGRDAQTSPIGHCITGIGRQVHQHLAELSDIGHNEHLFVRKRGAELDILPDDPLNKFACVDDYGLKEQWVR